MTSVARNPRKFGQLLKTAVRKIALIENKKIAIVQDELGFALGRDSGGVSIQFWERGNIPAKPQDVEKLQELLLQQQGLTPEEGTRFARYAGFAELAQAAVQPFIAGPPISQPQHFFGRKYELKRLFGLWKYENIPMQNAAIIGPRGSGKTSLLLHLKNITAVPAAQLRPGQQAQWLPHPESFQWVFVDFRNPQLGTRAGLLRHILVSLDLSVPDPCNLDHFVEMVSRNLPGPTVILLDEIGVALARYAELDDTFWDGLRAIASTQVEGKMAFVLSARETPSAVAQRNNRSSDFFSIFAYAAQLGPLVEAEAHELIAHSPSAFQEEDVAWILAQSQGWPLLVQILCRERLIALEEGNSGDDWKAAGLQQIVPFQHLLAE